MCYSADASNKTFPNTRGRPVCLPRQPHRVAPTRFRFRLLPFLFSVWLLACPAGAMGSSRGSSLEPLNRFPRMVQEYFVRAVRRVENQANARRATLKT